MQLQIQDKKSLKKLIYAKNILKNILMQKAIGKLLKVFKLKSLIMMIGNK